MGRWKGREMEGKKDGREIREIKGMVGKRKMESRGRWRGREMEEEGDGGEGRWKAEGAGVEGKEMEEEDIEWEGD